MSARLTQKDAPMQKFTTRQWDVATLVTQGLTNKEIAERLEISPETVKSHLVKVMLKLQVQRRGAVALAMQKVTYVRKL